jgi:hypothetical protein
MKEGRFKAMKRTESHLIAADHAVSSAFIDARTVDLMSLSD